MTYPSSYIHAISHLVEGRTVVLIPHDGLVHCCVFEGTHPTLHHEDALMRASFLIGLAEVAHDNYVAP